MEFHSTVELGGKTATGFEVPGDIVEALGSGKRPAVTRRPLSCSSTSASSADAQARGILAISG